MDKKQSKLKSQILYYIVILKSIINDNINNKKILNTYLYLLEAFEYDDGLLELFKEEMIEISKNIDNWISIKKDEQKNKDEKMVDVVILIEPGAGGQEAKLWMKDLSNMYFKYANNKNFNCKIKHTDRNVEIMLTEVSIEIFKNILLKENGIHRVQRIPQTEKKGRLQTSTASVFVSEKTTFIQSRIKEKDLIIQTMKSSGPGGQHVNKTSSAVRVIDPKTGIKVKIQQRSQHQSKEEALQEIQKRLTQKEQRAYNQIKTEEHQKISGDKSRNLKIRTYNYPNNRIINHVTNTTFNDLSDVMNGNIESIH